MIYVRKIAFPAFSLYIASGTVCLTADLKAEDIRGVYINAGLLGALYDESSEVFLGGRPVSGLDLEIDNDWTLGVEIGYRFNELFSASVTVGVPPSTSVWGNESLPVKVGSISYGPLVVATQYHFTVLGPRFEPYIGAGVAYMIVLDEKDGALENLRVDNAFGAVLQFGVESRLDEHWGLFADFKKIWLQTEATGTIASLPARAEVSLDPLVATVGISYRF